VKGSVVYDVLFYRESVVDIDAAIIGVSRSEWKSVSASVSLDKARDKMRRHGIDVLPFTDEDHGDSRLSGYWQTTKWGDPESPLLRKDVKYDDVIALGTHVKDLISRFVPDDRRFFFLSNQRGIVGIVTIADLNKRSVKVYIYSLLSDLEMRLADFILDCVTEKVLLDTKYSSRGDSKEKTPQERYADDRLQGLDVRFVEYLYMRHLIKVVKDNNLHGKLGYSSKTVFDNELGSLVELRNAVAHPARSLITKEESVARLWERLNRIEKAIFQLRRWSAPKRIA